MAERRNLECVRQRSEAPGQARQGPGKADTGVLRCVEGEVPRPLRHTPSRQQVAGLGVPAGVLHIGPALTHPRSLARAEAGRRGRRRQPWRAPGTPPSPRLQDESLVTSRARGGPDVGGACRANRASPSPAASRTDSLAWLWVWVGAPLVPLQG